MRQQKRNIGLLLSVLCCLLVVVAFSQQQAESPAVDPDAYKEFMATQVLRPSDLADWLVWQQWSWLPLVPPDESGDSVLRQPSGQVLPADWNVLPPELIKGLTLYYENSVPAYKLWLAEDRETRQTIFYNEDWQEIYAIEPATDYDPLWFLKDYFPELFSGHYTPWYVDSMIRLYDSARVASEVTLIPSEYAEDYLYVKDLLAQEAEKAEEESGGGIMMMYEGPAVSNLCFVDIQRQTNFINMTIAYPYDGATYPTNCFTNILTIFHSPDLREFWWEPAVTTNVSPTTNWIEWTDTSTESVSTRYYYACRADIDTDGDSFSDPSERLKYHSDPSNAVSRPVNVSGSIIYTGPETGAIYILTTLISNGWSIGCSTAINGPGPYTNNEVATLNSYWFRAFRDVNTDQARETWEPWGIYSTSTTYVATNLSGVNITLADVPTIWGTISYTGTNAGNIYVVAVTNPNSWSTNYSCTISWPQGGTTSGVNYMIEGLPGSNYWIRAFLDEDDNGEYTALEVAGQYASNAIPVSNRVTGIDFTLDQDSDADQMPDWWEWQYGLNALTNDAAGDPDGDELPNLEEYLHSTNPTNPDTDGDGMPDGWELQYGLNPLTNDAAGDPDVDGKGNGAECNWTNSVYYISCIHGSSNPTNMDTDLDGVSDGPIGIITNGIAGGPDAFPTDTNAWEDTDCDGMPDNLTSTNSGLTADADSDNDGLTNGVDADPLIPITIAPFKVVTIQNVNPTGDTYTEEFDVSSGGRMLPYAIGADARNGFGRLHGGIYFNQDGTNLYIGIAGLDQKDGHAALLLLDTTTGGVSTLNSLSVTGKPFGLTRSQNLFFNSTSFTPNVACLVGGRYGDGKNYSSYDMNGGTPRNWGLYSYSSGTSTATRTLSAPMGTGKVFSIDMDNGYLNTGGQVGFELQTASGSNRFRFFFTGGSNYYERVDGSGRNSTGTQFTDAGLRIQLTLTNANAYSLSVVKYYDSTTQTLTGVLGGPTNGLIEQFRAFSMNVVGGPTNNVFFNRLLVGDSAGDVASDGAYHDGWSSGDNGGFGLGAWSLQSANGGTIIESSTNNGITRSGDQIDLGRTNNYGQGVYLLDASGITDFPGFTNDGAHISQWGDRGNVVANAGIEIRLSLSTLALAPGNTFRAAAIIMGPDLGSNRVFSLEAYGESMSGSGIGPINLIGAPVYLSSVSAPTYSDPPSFTNSDVILQGFSWNVPRPPISDYQSMTVAGSFNSWNQSLNNMTLVADHTWEYIHTFTNETGVLFKFTANGSWGTNWGDVDQGDFDLPISQVADLSGGNIAISGTNNGPVRFRFNTSTSNYTVEAVSTGTVTVPLAGYSTQFWYEHLNQQAQSNEFSRFTKVWMSPPSKGNSGRDSVGYDLFDQYDAGSYYEKYTTVTRYGSETDLLACVAAIKAKGIAPLADLVLNHMNGGYGTTPPRYNFQPSSHDIFEKPDTNGQLNANHYFNYGVADEPFERDYGFGLTNTSPEFIMKTNDVGAHSADINHRHPYMRQGLENWGCWLLSKIGYEGTRLDFTPGIEPWFTSEILNYGGLKNKFSVMEYWENEADATVGEYETWLALTDYRAAAFDMPLHQKLETMCNYPANFNMEDLNGAGLTAKKAQWAVTFVESHDTIRPFGNDGKYGIFQGKLLAYAFVLMSEGQPTVAYNDYFIGPYYDPDPNGPSGWTGAPLKPEIDDLIDARVMYAAGSNSYLSVSNKTYLYIAKRSGVSTNDGCLLVINNHTSSSLSNTVQTGWTNSTTLVDVLNTNHMVSVSNGWATVGASNRSYRVYVRQEIYQP